MDHAPERRVDSFRSSTGRWLLGSFAGWATLASCAVGVGFVLIAWRWLQDRSAAFEVTDQRLIIRRGILFKTVDEIELYRIKDVRLHYSVVNQLTGIGTVTLTSSDPTSSGASFVMRDIAMAEDRREGLRTLVERARRRRGVRELDVDTAEAG
jgi:uncharacterized membrane protein YdbT with pleckstrin-like domain